MITISNVSKWYGKIQVLKNCLTEVAKGEVVVVCGPSGSGKSTLIKCVNALEPFEEGTITVDGVSVGDPKTNIAEACLDGPAGRARPFEQPNRRMATPIRRIWFRLG